MGCASFKEGVSTSEANRHTSSGRNASDDVDAAFDSPIGTFGSLHDVRQEPSRRRREARETQVQRAKRERGAESPQVHQPTLVSSSKSLGRPTAAPEPERITSSDKDVEIRSSTTPHDSSADSLLAQNKEKNGGGEFMDQTLRTNHPQENTTEMTAVAMMQGRRAPLKTVPVTPPATSRVALGQVKRQFFFFDDS